MTVAVLDMNTVLVFCTSDRIHTACRLCILFFSDDRNYMPVPSALAAPFVHCA
jgi:hypothetical protein